MSEPVIINHLRARSYDEKGKTPPRFVFTDFLTFFSNFSTKNKNKIQLMQ